MLSAIPGISSARSALRLQAELIVFTMLHDRRARRLADRSVCSAMSVGRR
jgi:hypothetical protein